MKWKYSVMLKIKESPVLEPIAVFMFKEHADWFAKIFNGAAVVDEI